MIKFDNDLAGHLAGMDTKKKDGRLSPREIHGQIKHNNLDNGTLRYRVGQKSS